MESSSDVIMSPPIIVLKLEKALPRNAFTVSGIPRWRLRNAVRHLESTFCFIRCQSFSEIWNRCIKWPEKC